jgi:hypothetical protein
MDIQECKQRIAEICHDIGSAMPYEADQVADQTGDDWQSIADYLKEMASILARGANRIAAYASNAQRKANRETQR